MHSFYKNKFSPQFRNKNQNNFFNMFSALLNHIKLLRTEIRLPVATICVFMTFLKQFSTLLRRDPSAVCRCVACNCRFRKQSLAIACRPVLKSDVGFFSYQIQTFHILYNPDKTKNLLFIDWKTTLVESYQSESWFRETPPSTYWPEALDFFIGSLWSTYCTETVP